MIRYRHRQVGTLVLGVGAVAVLSLILLLCLVEVSLVGIVVLCVLLACFAMFSTLTVEVTDAEIRLRFGPGLIRKGFPLGTIADARAVRNRWYHGWGIRTLPRVWLYNVSGLDAVEIQMTDGAVHRIGTDEPAALLDAIQGARAAAR